MAATTTNGVLAPPTLPLAPTSPSLSLAKRKRSDTPPVHLSNGASAPAPATAANGARQSRQAVLDDILSVLKSYDTQPSILDLPITSAIARAASGQSESKRAKLTPPDGPTTIASLIKDGSYSSLEALERDVESSSVQVLASIGAGGPGAEQHSVEQTRLQVLAFRKMLKTLATREEVRNLHVHAKEDSADSSVENGAETAEDKPVEIKEEEAAPDSRTVLTLYGNAQGPKQLFSSLQQPVRVSSSAGQGTPSLDTSIKVTLPLRESNLPNIISTTQVYPPTEEVDDKQKKKVATFGELYRPPAHIPQLSPPKLAKPLTTKGSTITFAPVDSLPKSSRKSSHSYANQDQSTGHWLGYGGVDIPKDPTSPTAKQKSRQRALSTGEAQLPSSGASLAAVQQAKEDALFRSVYSSFAPSRDDATAIIPGETKNKIWWKKIGEKRFNDTFPIDPALLGLDESAEVGTNSAVDNEEDFKDAVENFTPVEADPFSKEKSDVEKNTEEILEEISDLLATLASHQRIRNSSLATNPRTPVVQNSSLASLAGSPSTPSSEEIDVYQILKSQLTLMISQLPPYAVAKLNGDQLEELNISRTIIIETNDYKGVLEEDYLSKLAKAPTMPVAAGPPALSRMASTGSGTHSHYPPASAQYSRSTPSVHASSARPVSNAQSYFPQQQSVHRSPSVHYQRTSSSHSQSYQAPVASYGNSTPRQSYPATQAFGQQTPRTGYAQAAPSQFYTGQRPAPPSNYGGVGNPQYYQSTPQAQAQNRYPPQQVQNGYYQRPQNVAPMHNYNAAQSPHGRTGSPLKAGTAPVNHAGYGSRPAYNTPVSGGQVRPSYYGQSQYGAPQAPTPAPAGPTVFNSISSNHQQMMLERQQTQQSQARLAAQNSFNSRQDSGTPQPPNPQYNGQPPVNGAPMVA
ncbi:hypothetical protein K505DRAFT_356545 [Melanomma pulvis-pyrius CBS 109.77]|uniref:Uncharacterized protein n=1 Tax=Melanomma pulvis-pyrius CBS 109.77 TaxID=1314802 RepID=A0A6A6XUR5_9PLEO|nr:hypothetical protein K505DRAFT_356545 [Melanomma pulvis-pyrius CBS 109.77]